MDPLSPLLRNAAWFLVLGGCLGVIGGCWPPYKQWSSPVEEGLRVIAEHPIGWRMIHTGFFMGVWSLVVGAVVFAYAVRGQPGGNLALIAAVLLTGAALCWTTNITYRLSITVHAAHVLVDTGSMPDDYAGWRRLAGFAFAGFSLFAYLAIAITGWFVLKSALAPTWLGWLMIAWGLSAGFVVGANVPLIAYIPYIILGARLLRGG